MRLLLLTFYYPPDLSAGSFRAKALVEALMRRDDRDLRIDVLTTSPNRYRSHIERASAREQTEAVSITRIPIPTHRGGLLDQSYSFWHFARRVLAATRGQKWDLVLATSSRLMTAALGSMVARRCGARLYLDIRDLFADTMADLFSGSPFKIIVPVLKLAERRTFAAADRINLVSPGFRAYVGATVPKCRLRFFTNGIDEEFLATDFARKPRGTEDIPLIVYAGNMGAGQGLDHVLPQAVRRLAGRARFRLIGDGGRRRHLETALGGVATGSVEIIDPVPRRQLCDHYRDADMLFLHLNNHAAFEKVLPSKIFEYAATGKRILAGVPGYAADFLRRNVAGCAVFDPCSVDGLVDGFDRLSGLPADVDREAFRREFARARIMDAMAGDVLSVMQGRGDDPGMVGNIRQDGGA